jgi:peptidyl-tRNA hydrolase
VGRADLPLNYQAVQNGHAAIDFQHEHMEIAKQWNQESNYLIYLSAKNESHLESILQKAEFRGLKTTSFREPDINNELTAIALEPSDLTKKLVSNLPLMGKEESLCA